MIDGTNLNQLTGSRQLLRAFGGINETYSCSEAELSAALNFSGRGFPALQTRALRKKVRDVEKVNGMYHLNGLLICRGTGLEYAPDGQAGRTAAVTLENVLTDDRKALAGMGSKVLIWPDKLAFDTETGQLETLGAKWELGDRKMTVCPCDTEGKMYEVAGAGDTEPESPEDGQLFLKGDPKNLYDYESVLEKWSAKSGKWVQVLVNTVRMTCPGIGSLLKEGDTVTLTGMPQAVCDALAADLNGEIVVQALEGDDLVASLTPAQDSSRYYGSWTVTLQRGRQPLQKSGIAVVSMRRIPSCGGRDGKAVRDRNTVQRIKDITPRSCRSKPVPKRFAAFSQGPAGEDGIQGIGAAPFILVIKIILLHLIKKADAIPGLFGK